MAQSAVIERPVTGQTLAQYQRGNESQSTTGITSDGYQIAAIKQILAEKAADKGKGEDILLANQFDQEHFGELIELGESLGLNDDIEAIFVNAADRPYNLSNLMEKISTALMTEVSEKMEQDKRDLLSGLIAHLKQNGYNINETQLEKLYSTFTGFHIGSLEIGINTSDNTNFDQNGKVCLSLSSPDADIIQLEEESNLIALSVQKVLRATSHHALLLSDYEALFHYTYQYGNLYELLGDELCNPLADITELVERVIAEGLDCYFYEDLDDEELNERVTDDVTILIGICSRETGIGDSFLSDWFASQIKELHKDAYQNLSYSTPLHFLITDDWLIGELNEAYEAICDETESRLQLNPAFAIDTLRAIANNRNLIRLFDSLCLLGNENRLHARFLKDHNIAVTDNDFFSNIQPQHQIERELPTQTRRQGKNLLFP